jgi:hypothetical protein
VPERRPLTSRAGLVRAVNGTLADAAALLSTSQLYESRGRLSFGGLVGGRLAVNSSRSEITLTNDQFFPGVRVSGTLFGFGLGAKGTEEFFGNVHGCGPGGVSFTGVVRSGGTAALRIVGGRRAARAACPR